MISAIVYTTNTGTTKTYAEMLGEQIHLPVYALAEAKKKLEKGTTILYLGWIMAGSVKGYKEADKYFHIPMVCAVGMGKTGSQTQEIRDRNHIPSSVAVFTLQGSFDRQKLQGIYKLMINVMIKTAGKALSEKADRTPEEDEMLDLMLHGGSRVSVEHLAGPIRRYRNEQKQG